jgi:hypothetical protein
VSRTHADYRPRKRLTGGRVMNRTGASNRAPLPQIICVVTTRPVALQRLPLAALPAALGWRRERLRWPSVADRLRARQKRHADLRRAARQLPVV